tara:strand:+ start:1501 stop:2898 length:1398 start_codon:yes stop_codon:yes gene_type:complete
MKVNKIKSFLEQTGNTKYRILVVSGDPKPKGQKLFRTARRFKEEAEKAGHELYIAEIEGAYIGFHDGVYKIYNLDDKKGFELNRDNTVAFVRGTVRLKKSYLNLVSRLEKTGITMVNSREVVEISSDKYRTYVKLQDFGLTQPRTALIPNKDGWKQAFESIDLKYPCIMKTIEGSKGIGVLFIESERQMESIVQLLYNENPDIDLLLQEYIKTDGDIRVIILGGKIIASMKRDVIEGDFRSNVSQGAKVKEYKMTELEIEESLKASKAIDGSWTAVDFIPSKNPKTEPPYILEVNHSPGTEGIEEASGKNIVKTVIDHFANPDNRYPVSTQCGFLEVINIKPFGELIAKFDTGNGASAPTIHADKIDVKGKSITWTLNDKTITSSIVKISNVDVGGLNNYSEKRYTVKLNFEFEGTNYTSNFMIDDREDRTPVLLNRNILRLLNVAVNPSRKYVATTKYSLDERK